MKRTPLKRGTKPMKRGKPPNAKRRGTARRVSVVRDRDYLDWLKGQVCVACKGAKLIYRDRLFASGGDYIDPAHGPVNGMGSKGGDDGAIPLCRFHHEEQHAIGWPAFESKYQIDRAALAAEHYKRFQKEKRA